MSSSSNARSSQRADVQDADHVPLDQERHTQHRLQALLAQDRVVDVRLREVQDPHRHARRRYPAREAAPERDAHAALDLLLEALRRTGDELVLVLVEEEDRGRVRAEDPDDAREQLVEQDVERKERKRGVRDALEITQPVGGYP